MPKPVRTIYDLAQLAGVSAATVSRALAGHPVVNAATAERVRKLAHEHGFRPSSLARNLRTQKSGAIGVVIPLGHERTQHISDPFFMTMIGSLADELTQRGFDLMLSRVIPERDDWLDQFIKTRRSDGLIIIGQSDQSGVLDKVANEYLPMVAWGAFIPGQTHCSVGSDNFLGGRLAMRHLIKQGSRTIAFLGNPRAIEITQRLEGARAEIAASPEDVQLIEVPTHLAHELSGEDIGSFLESCGKMPDAIFASSDMIAFTAVQALSVRGISVPGDVRVVGFDDLAIAQNMTPKLTTIRQDFATGAHQLVNCLLQRIAGKLTGSVVLNPELIVRDSG